MAQESLDKELFGGLGGPRYGTTIDPSSRNAASKSKGGDLYSFLPAQWGIGGASGAASIDSKRQQEIMVSTQSQGQELGTYFPQTGGPRYYVKYFSLRNPILICFPICSPQMTTRVRRVMNMKKKKKKRRSHLLNLQYNPNQQQLSRQNLLCQSPPLLVNPLAQVQ